MKQKDIEQIDMLIESWMNRHQEDTEKANRVMDRGIDRLRNLIGEILQRLDKMEEPKPEPKEIRKFCVKIQGEKPMVIEAEEWKHYFDEKRSACFLIAGERVATFQNVDAIYLPEVVRE